MRWLVSVPRHVGLEQLILTRDVNERFLDRLGSARHAHRYVRKGAARFTLWTGAPHRPTRDLDLLGSGDPGEPYARDHLSEDMARDVFGDGFRLDCVC